MKVPLPFLQLPLIHIFLGLAMMVKNNGKAEQRRHYEPALLKNPRETRNFHGVCSSLMLSIVVSNVYAALIRLRFFRSTFC